MAPSEEIKAEVRLIQNMASLRARGYVFDRRKNAVSIVSFVHNGNGVFVGLFFILVAAREQRISMMQ